MKVELIIEKLGGTSATARLCDIKAPSVSEWKAKGKIPKAQERYLRLARPDAFVPDGAGDEQKAA